MSEKKKRFILKKGMVFQIPLGDGTYGYGQIVGKAQKNFFDFRNNGEHPDLEMLANLPVLFQISVYDRIFKDGIWPIIGVAPVNEKNVNFVKGYFHYDSSEKHYLLWEPTGKKVIEPSQLDGCEYVSVWDYRSTQQRLLDTFEERPNYWVERDKNMHNPNFPDIVTFYKQYGYDFKFDDE